jgi:hypothetical protein
MTKFLLPILILAGLALGVVLLLRRRHVTVPLNTSPVKAVILLAAASIVGIGCKNKIEERTTCYKVAVEPLQQQDAGAPQDRAETLDRLHEQGKLPDAAYRETLEKLLAELEEAGEPTQAEKEYIKVRREADVKVVKALETHDEWKALRTQAAQLAKLLADKTSTYDAEAVTKAVDSLASRGLILEKTREALSTTITQIGFHHDRMSSGRTCYKMTRAGFNTSRSRGRLLELFKLLEQDPSDKEFAAHLDTLASSVTCLLGKTEEACPDEPATAPTERASLVQTLDLLLALRR